MSIWVPVPAKCVVHRGHRDASSASACVYGFSVRSSFYCTPRVNHSEVFHSRTTGEGVTLKAAVIGKLQHFPDLQGGYLTITSHSERLKLARYGPQLNPNFDFAGWETLRDLYSEACR